MNLPSDEELIALYEQGGFEAIQRHAEATAHEDSMKILSELLTQKPQTNNQRKKVEMKIQIKYKKNADVDAPCIAQTEVMGEALCSIGRTWEQAKERLMQKLDSYLNSTAPPPENVEVKVAGEEMDTEFFKALDPLNYSREIEAGKV